MSRRMVPLLLWCVTLLAAEPAAARDLHARIDRITTAAARMEGVDVRLAWPADADHGELQLRANSLDAPDLGYRFRALAWRCPLTRGAGGRWLCSGPVRSGGGAPLQLAIDVDAVRTQARLGQGDGSLSLQRSAATPDATTIDLARVPLAWAQALLRVAWSQGQLKSGRLSGRLQVDAPANHPLRVAGRLDVADAAFDTPDASIAGEHLGGGFDLDYRKDGALTTMVVDGQLHGGEFLAGDAYVALPATPVALRIEARQSGTQGWQLPRIDWRDGNVLAAEGGAAFDTAADLQALDLHLHASDAAPLRERYLSGWLGLFDLGELQMRGAFDARLQVRDARLQAAEVALHDVGLDDPAGRFRFEGLDGTVRFSASASAAGELRWRGGQLYGLDFSAATLPMDSSEGELRLRDAVTVPMLGGSLRFDRLSLRPPSGDSGLQMHFGLAVDRIDIGRLAQALDLPAFQGQLSGHIPDARYRDERMDFDGGLTLQLFGGTVGVSALSMERPFGVAPSLSADLVLDDIDLQSLTGVFDFGSISGKLDGHIRDLRLVDWTATAFDAELHTDPDARVRRRISQRAVQNISSVGDASFATTLQSQLIGLFDDFGYRRIGISCRLANEVCEMGGLEGTDGTGSAGGFTIVEGSGIPRLMVVGFNRTVDWPTLLERLAAASKGDVAPVVQ